MTLKETLDDFKETVEKQTATVNGYNVKIDTLLAAQSEFKIQQAVMCNQFKNIVEDNLEFKNDMTKNVSNLKTDFYKVKSTVERHGVWFTVIHFITVTVVGWLGFK